MNRNSIILCVALICLFASVSAKAQRPVWVVGHACNSHECLIYAIEDNASGVEIDIHSDQAHCRTDWSVNHGSDKEKYLDKATRESRNRSEGRTGNRCYVSLEEYLNFEEMDKIHILWLDVKTADYLVDLVKHVHGILEKRYTDPRTKQFKVPFSIIYGIYDYHILANPEPNTTDSRIKLLKSLLWENEGLNMAYEGKEKGSWQSGSFDNIEKTMKSVDFPIAQHFMTCGFGEGNLVFSNSIEPQCIRKAREMMLKDQYCGRVGFWTCCKENHGRQLVCAESDFSGSYKTECDLILIECRTEFWPVKHLPGAHSPHALNNFTANFFEKDGKWKGNNNGKYRLADFTDKFYIKYSEHKK